MYKNFIGSILLVVVIFTCSFIYHMFDSRTLTLTHTPFSVAAIFPRTAEETILLGQKININTATAPMLETLPGIGQSLAEKILKYRGKNGRFRSLEDLDKVEGIGPKKLSTLQELTSF